METIFNSLFKSWKTTVTGIVAGLVWLAAQYGFAVPQDVSNAVIVVALFVIGVLAKDSNVTGK